MTALNRIELQTGFPASNRDASPRLTAHEHIGFELGWDYAHHRVTPPAPYAQEPSPLRNGLLAGQAAFGARTLAATRPVRKWLQLRLHAWLRGRSVELVQVTPNYLQQIDVSHCPITRMRLSSATLAVSDASVDRVRNDAGYAAGNLAVMSTRANHAKAACGFRDALRRGQALEAEAGAALPGLSAEPGHALPGLSAEPGHALPGLTAEPGHALPGLSAEPGHALPGLTAEQWSRVAVLCSFVEPLPHDEACALPLLVLPPNRLRLFNPVQALQAFVSRQLLKPGWARRVSGFEDLLPAKPLKRDFKAFFMALLPRVLEGDRFNDTARTPHTPETPHTPHTRWAIEDAWRSPLVQQRWTRFARQLTAAQCEALLLRAAAHRLATAVIVPFSDASATDGWNLDTRGYVAHAAEASPRREPAAQRQFVW
jgi:hypothetical protein